MDSISPELRQLILDEKNDGVPQKPDQSGRYDDGGTVFPKAGVGQGAVIFLEREDGGYEVLCSQRSARMTAHPGKWGIVGGYLNVKDGEGPLEAIWREVREETKGAVDLAGEIPFRVLQPYMDYKDKFNKATIVVQYMFILHGDKAKKVRDGIRKEVADGSFDSEVMNFDLLPVDDHLEKRIAEKGGFGYPQSLRALRMAIHYLPPAEAVRPVPAFSAKDQPCRNE